MGSHQGPDADRHLSHDIFDHLEHLNADFNSLLNTLEASSFRVSSSKASSSEPSKNSLNLRDNIDKGTTKCVAEAERGGHQVTIPLAQLYSLHGSYQQLRAKLNTQLPTTAGHSSFAAVGEEAASKSAVFNGIEIFEMKSYSATIILKIVHQASVNRMEGKDSRHLGEAVFASLEAFFSKKWFRGSIQISSARVLDSGDVEIIAHTEHRGDLERLIQTTAWHEDFERSLGPLPSQTYNVRMHNMRIGCMELRNRKEKSAVVMALVDTNFPVESENGNRTIIGDISWCRKDLLEEEEKEATTLIIEFLFPEHGNKALGKGLNWQGNRHHCNIADRHIFGLLRCRNCQHYGHLMQTCSAEPRCAKCAGQHQEEDCKSTYMRCVLCGGPHRSARQGCQIQKQAKKGLRFFPVTFESPAIEPLAGVHAAINTEPEQSEAMFDHTQDGHTIPGTLFQRANDFRSVGMARDIGLQPSVAVKLKREAEDALPEAETCGDAKRIKQEDLKQEDSPDREDSMGPYQQPSPCIIHQPD